MVKFTGKVVCEGVALGPVVVMRKADSRIKRRHVEDVDAEIRRVEDALALAKKQLHELYEKAVTEVGEKGAAIFEAHQMMLEEPHYLDAIREKIRAEEVGAEFAAASVGDNFSGIFFRMDDAYMRERAADVQDISGRLVRCLSGKEDPCPEISEPSVIVADDLSPSETVRMNRKNILAFVLTHGSRNSHTAILARMMGVPALIGVPVDFETVHTGMKAVVDGFRGEVVFEPDEACCEAALQKIEEEREVQSVLQTLKGRETVTQDGKKIRLFANAGSIEELEAAAENDAEGIGLFRSEFLYLGRDRFPEEEELFQIYKKAIEMMDGKKVIVRTLDVGADKQAAYFNLEKEANPAMGCRGIRVCLKQPEILRTQLRALFRAAVFGSLAVMYPMIISTQEVEKIQEIAAEVKAELEGAGIPFRFPEQGIMIETPAAVMVSDELAKTVDFFSIGTNDLTQYTLAVDRQNESLSEFYEPHHEAILRMIRMATESAHQHGKPVGICGDLAADPELTGEFIRMGIDELSVAPSRILRLRKNIREMNMINRHCSGYQKFRI